MSIDKKRRGTSFAPFFLATNPVNRPIAVLTLCLWVWPVAAAEEAPANAWQLDARVSRLHFNYKEMDDSGAVLDREYGWIPGVGVEGSFRRANWVFAGGWSVHSGDVTYDGQTQSGVPLMSRTDMFFLDLYGRVEWWRWGWGENRMAVYGGLGFRRWDREIRSSHTASGTPVSGLDEYYYWNYAFVGDKLVFRGGGSDWGLDFRLTRTLNSYLDIPAQLGYDRNTLKLGDRFGGRISGSWRREIKPRFDIGVEPYYERWDFGRSATEPLTRSGLVVGTVYEPRSETRNFGVDFSLNWRF